MELSGDKVVQADIAESGDSSISARCCNGACNK